MKPFLYSVAEYLNMHFHDKMHHIAVVFPNKRARLFFNQYLSEIISEPVFSPTFFTITEIMEDISGVQCADELPLIFHLYDSYCKNVNNPYSLDYFYPYCQTLIADFDDIEKYLIDAKMLFQNLSDIKNIEASIDFLSENQKNTIFQTCEPVYV